MLIYFVFMGESVVVVYFRLNYKFDSRLSFLLKSKINQSNHSYSTNISVLAIAIASNSYSTNICIYVLLYSSLLVYVY